MVEKLDLSQVRVDRVIVHKVGNKFRDEGIVLSEAESERSPLLDELLIKHFLFPVINGENEYLLTHESDINLNTIQHYSSMIFDNEDSFISASSAIAKHLYISSTHPNIGGGEFIEVLYNGILFNDSEIQALGLFRIETRSSYLDIKNNNGVLGIVEKRGISIDSIQKGAVILSIERTVFIVDSLGKKTKYWIDGFIKAIPKNTTNKYTQILGNVAKSISLKISSPQERLNFSEALLNEEELSINQLKKISSSFIEMSCFNSIVDSVGIKNGITIDADFVVETQHISKKLRKISSQTNISKGVDIVISESNLKIVSIDLQDTDFGLRAIVDIKKGG